MTLSVLQSPGGTEPFRSFAGTIPRVVIAVERPDRESLVRHLLAQQLLPLVAMTFQHVLTLLKALRVDMLVLDQAMLSAASHEPVEWRGMIDKVALLGPAPEDLTVDVYVVDGSVSAVELSILVREALGAHRSTPQRWGDLEIDHRCREARWMGHRLDISPMQLRLLSALVDASGAVVSKTDLAWRLFGNASTQDERIETHVRRIRRQLAMHAGGRSVLLTVRGEGYRLADSGGPTRMEPYLATA